MLQYVCQLIANFVGQMHEVGLSKLISWKQLPAAIVNKVNESDKIKPYVKTVGP